MRIAKTAYKVLLIGFFIISGINQISAQSNWEIGLRFGDVVALDATIPIAAAPRLHPAIYFYDDLSLGTYFDWMFAIEGDLYGFKLYPGVGPELHFGNELDLGVAGDFGIEYSFDFPLTIGLDWRPGLMLTDGFDLYTHNWGIFARFRFGEGVRFVRAH